MTTQRGYSGAPRHSIQKRTYRNCTECGKRTWSPAGVCSACSGRTASREEYILTGRYTERGPVGERVWEMLRDTSLMQREIAEQCDVSPSYVSAIRRGAILSGLTGGYVLRPYERGN